MQLRDTVGPLDTYLSILTVALWNKTSLHYRYLGCELRIRDLRRHQFNKESGDGSVIRFSLSVLAIGLSVITGARASSIPIGARFSHRQPRSTR